MKIPKADQHMGHCSQAGLGEGDKADWLMYAFSLIMLKELVHEIQ